MVTPSPERGKPVTPLAARLNFAAEYSLAHSIYGEMAVLLEYVMRVRSVSKCNTRERRPPEWPCQSGYFPESGTRCCRPRRDKPRRKARWCKDVPAWQKPIE